jgi:hypothetical protein
MWEIFFVTSCYKVSEKVALHIVLAMHITLRYMLYILGWKQNPVLLHFVTKVSKKVARFCVGPNCKYGMADIMEVNHPYHLSVVTSLDCLLLHRSM